MSDSERPEWGDWYKANDGLDYKITCGGLGGKALCAEAQAQGNLQRTVSLETLLTELEGVCIYRERLGARL